MNLTMTILLILSVIISSSANQFKLCLKEIANKYFQEQYIIIMYWRGSEWTKKELIYKETPLASEDEIIKSFVQDERWTIKVYKGDMTKNADIKSDHRTRHILILVDSDTITNLTKLKGELKLSKTTMGWRSQGQILIVIREKPGNDGMSTARLVLEALWGFTKACNAVVMMVKDQNLVNLYKWHPYTDECDKVDNVRLIDFWKNGSFIHNIELFSRDGVTNLNRCPLKVGAFPNPPYVLVPEGHATNFTKGLDIKITQMLSELYNFTINYVTLSEGKFPYIIFDSEGKASGFHGMLQKQELDLMIFGCRIHELRNMLADPLDSYAEDALVWVVPTPRLVPSWRNLGDAFTPTVWLLFGLFFILITFTLYLISNYHRSVTEPSTLRTYVSCVLASLGVLLNNSVTRPRSTLLRFFMFVLSLFAINANSAYQSSLIALLTSTRYEKPFVTPMDAVMGGVKTYLFPSGNITYNQTDHDMWNIIFQADRHAFVEDFTPAIREIALEKTAMIMMAQNVAGFEIRTKYMTQDNTPRAIFLKEKFSLYRVTAYVSSGHPLREHFRRKVNQMVEGGLVEYWLNEVFVTSEHQFVSKQDEEGTKPLTLQHLQGPFFILLIALLVSFQVFCFELIFQKIIENFKLKLF